MYKELIERLSRENGYEYVKIQPPCSEADIKMAEEIVGYRFPRELYTLLCEMNGDKWCFMSVESIMENVKSNREIWLPLFMEDYSEEEYIDKIDRFIFFAGNGCGDYYCYRVGENGIADESAIYIWEHEYLGEKCWRRVAGGMEEFITRYYGGEI